MFNKKLLVLVAAMAVALVGCNKENGDQNAAPVVAADQAQTQAAPVAQPEQPVAQQAPVEQAAPVVQPEVAAPAPASLAPQQTQEGNANIPNATLEMSNANTTTTTTTTTTEQQAPVTK